MVETERFVRTFDKFFDCLNVRSRDEYISEQKSLMWHPTLAQMMSAWW